MNNYSTKILWSPEYSCYVAFCPELGDASALGDTKEIAMQELDNAVEAMLEVMNEAGQSIPTPDQVKEFSGQVLLRMSKSLHGRLSSQAKEEEISLNSYMNGILHDGSTQYSSLAYIGRRLQEFGYRAVAMMQKKAQIKSGNSNIINFQDCVEMGKNMVDPITNSTTSTLSTGRWTNPVNFESEGVS